MDYVVSTQVNEYPKWIDNGNRFINSKWGILLYIISITIVILFYLKIDPSSIKNIFSEFTTKLTSKSSSPSSIYPPVTQTTLDKFKSKGPTGLFILSGIMIFIGFVLYLVNYIRYNKSNIIKITNGITDAKNRFVYDKQVINTSDNRPYGSEFAYGMWIKIDDWFYNRLRKKFILVKGSLDDGNKISSFAPSIYMTSNNTLRVDIQTFSSINNEFSELNDIPLKKWFHLLVGIQGKNLDIYINGVLAKRKVLDGLPIQNRGPVYVTPAINDNGNVTDPGFGGLLGDVTYYRYYPNQSELLRIIQKQPSETAKPCGT
jgi:hypothetical protein